MGNAKLDLARRGLIPQWSSNGMGNVKKGKKKRGGQYARPQQRSVVWGGITFVCDELPLHRMVWGGVAAKELNRVIEEEGVTLTHTPTRYTDHTGTPIQIGRLSAPPASTVERARIVRRVKRARMRDGDGGHEGVAEPPIIPHNTMEIVEATSEENADEGHTDTHDGREDEEADEEGEDGEEGEEECDSTTGDEHKALEFLRSHVDVGATQEEWSYHLKLIVEKLRAGRSGRLGSVPSPSNSVKAIDVIDMGLDVMALEHAGKLVDRILGMGDDELRALCRAVSKRGSKYLCYDRAKLLATLHTNAEGLAKYWIHGTGTGRRGAREFQDMNFERHEVPILSAGATGGKRKTPGQPRGATDVAIERLVVSHLRVSLDGTVLGSDEGQNATETKTRPRLRPLPAQTIGARVAGGEGIQSTRRHLENQVKFVVDRLPVLAAEERLVQLLAPAHLRATRSTSDPTLWELSVAPKYSNFKRVWQGWRKQVASALCPGPKLDHVCKKVGQKLRAELDAMLVDK